MMKILTAILLLILGLAVYWLFRPGIYFFYFFLPEYNQPLITSDNPYLVFIKNHLPDITWCFAAFLIASLLIEKKYPVIYPALLILLPFISEVLQQFGIVPGTFDWIDLLLYITLFLLFVTKKILDMQNFKKHFPGTIAIAVFIFALLASAGPKKTTYTYTKGTVRLAEKDDEIFRKPSLTKILETTKNLSIVLRTPNLLTKILDEQKYSTNSIYNTIEKEFVKAGTIVRDRGLFQQVLENTTVDYSKIKELTETDLILEIVGLEKIKNRIDKYTDPAGNQKITNYEFGITSLKAEFKIISVKENDFIGSYVFYSTPCTNGCTYTFNQFGTPNDFTDRLTMSVEVENFFKECSLRLIQELKPK